MDNPRRFLRFRETVLQDFSFLESLGLSVVEANDTYVRFSGLPVDVEVFHGRQSYEIGLNVLRRGISYSLSELLALQSSSPHETGFSGVFAATDARSVEVGVARTASAFRAFTASIFSDDARIYDELENQRRSNRRELARASLADQLKPVADEAFRNGDYRRAADLYERIRERLSPAELRRLEIAKSRS